MSHVERFTEKSPDQKQRGANTRLQPSSLAKGEAIGHLLFTTEGHGDTPPGTPPARPWRMHDTFDVGTAVPERWQAVCSTRRGLPCAPANLAASLSQRGEQWDSCCRQND